MPFKLAERLQGLQPSLTFALTAKEHALRAVGRDIISLGIGETDFDTPSHIIDAAKAAMDAGFTRYTATSGISTLKEAIIAKLQQDNKLNYTSEQITVTAGTKQALYNFFQAVLNPGDEVIILAPYFVSYLDQVRLAGGKSVIIETTAENGFKATAEELRSAITPRTKVLLINSPNNPTGAVYNLEELEAIASVCLKHNLLVVSDEIYEHLIYDEHQHFSIASIGPELYKRTIVINGLSKAYAMTGWRIGYAAGPQEIIAAMTAISSQSTSCCTSIAQHAAVAALTGPQDSRQKMCDEFAERRKYLVAAINQLPLLSCQYPAGAFYVYIDVGEWLLREGTESAEAFTDALLEAEGVSILPGKSFGSTGAYARISYATSMETLQAAVERIERFVS